MGFVSLEDGCFDSDRITSRFGSVYRFRFRLAFYGTETLNDQRPLLGFRLHGGCTATIPAAFVVLGVAAEIFLAVTIDIPGLVPTVLGDLDRFDFFGGTAHVVGADLTVLRSARARGQRPCGGG